MPLSGIHKKMGTRTIRVPISSKKTILLLILISKNRLRGREPRNRNAIRRAAHVVEAYVVTEHHRLRLAAVFAADADIELRIHLATEFDADLHQFANSGLIYRYERVARQDLPVDVFADELSGIVARETEGRLREIVCTEKETKKRGHVPYVPPLMTFN